ncbi:MAG: hypothetical protein ACRC10_05390 [Thermoguttaceae bacterium]
MTRQSPALIQETVSFFRSSILLLYKAGLVSEPILGKMGQQVGFSPYFLIMELNHNEPY